MFNFILTISTSVFLLVSSIGHSCPLSPLEEENYSRPTLPIEMWSPILETVAFGQCMDNQKPGNLMLVCKDWCTEIQHHMQPGKPCYKAFYGIYGHEDIYETFLNGVLIYKPDPNSDEDSDERIIKLKISDLLNPLEGTFDLSKCGDMGKYLVISTGYRKGINPANKGKTEIWIAPRFLIEKKIAPVPHYLGIMKDWDENAAPVGVFFTWWDDPNKDFDYCTSKDLNFISENSLYSIWKASELSANHARGWRAGEVSCSFLTQNMDY